MTTEWLLLGLALALTAACGVFVAAEFSLVTVSNAQVDRAVADGVPGARGVQRARRSLSTQLSGAQVGITVTNLAIGYLAEPSAARLLRPPLEGLGLGASTVNAVGWVIAIVLATTLTMLFGELVPKNLAIAHPLGVARKVQAPQRLFTAVTRPLTGSLNAMANAIVRALGVEPQEELASSHSPQELASLVESSVESGTFGAAAAGIVRGSLRLDDKLARDAMTPRTRMHAVRADDPAEAVIATAQAVGRSRFPVLGEDIDDVVGLVEINHAVAVPRGERRTRLVRDIAQEPLTVPDSLPLDDLLWAMRRARAQLAVVVDEYGGTAGVVTFEDVVEEIVGAVTDEHDPPESGVTPEGEGAWSISGLVRPDELYDAIGVRVAAGGGHFETVAGYVLEELGRLAEVGDQVRGRGYILKVRALDGHRIDRLHLTRVDPDDDDADHKDEDEASQDRAPADPAADRRSGRE